MKGALLGKIEFGDEKVEFDDPNQRNLVAEVSRKEVQLVWLLLLCLCVCVTMVCGVLCASVDVCLTALFGLRNTPIDDRLLCVCVCVCMHVYGCMYVCVFSSAMALLKSYVSIVE